MHTGRRERLDEGLGSSYRIRQDLGGGGMSATYIAEETALGRDVVLKVLSPELAVGLNVERFRREIHLAARLQHAFIVPLLAAGVTDGQPWYTMPLVQGESLRTRIAREGALTPAASARILRDVAEALAYAHSQGVVHRDIKPDNILLSGTHALVADFGVAKALSLSTDTESGVTATGMAIGTPAYMAPEQAAGDPAVDHRADLYALGVTAFEMLTGRPLFGTRPPAQMLAAHAVEQADRLARVAPGTPAELAALVDQLLAKHPDDRPARAQAVADELTAMLVRWTSGELAPAARMTLGRALAAWAVAFVGVAGSAWLAVRWLPIPEWTFVAAVMLLLAALPVLALTAWLHRPARPLPAVPSVASTTAVGRIAAAARPHITWSRARRMGFVAVGALALIAAAWATSRVTGVGPAATLRAQGRIAATDRVFVADFDSPPSDSTLGSVVGDLVRTEIGRSPSIQLVTDARRAVTLQAMGRPITARVGSAQAHEFALRANAKAYLAGTVTQVGSSYLLRADLVETATRTNLASFKASARSADDVISAVDRMGREIRERLGASLREIRSSPELYWSVTPSLEAARLFTQGLRFSNSGDQESSIRVLERAVQADSEFAMAYRRLASYYNNLGRSSRAAWAAERAYRYRSKLPPGQQLVVEGTYFTSPAAYDPQRAIAAYEQRLESFGPEGAALNNVALAYWDARNYERALTAYREALKNDSLTTFPSVSIASVMWASGRREETRRHVLETLPRLLPGSRAVLTTRAALAAAELKLDSAERILAEGLPRLRSAAPTQRAIALQELAAAERARGRLAAARRHVAEAAALRESRGIRDVVPRVALYRAELLAWEERRPAEARRLLDSITAAHPLRDSVIDDYPFLSLAAAYGRAGDGARARAMLAAWEGRATPSMEAYDARALGLARGWTALAERRYADAVTAFRFADVGRCRTCAIAPLAHAYDLAGQRDSAVAVFERYLATPELGRLDQDQQYLAATYKRLGELREALGDHGAARSYYLRFVDLWRDADPELQPVVAEVRRRLSAPGAKRVE